MGPYILFLLACVALGLARPAAPVRPMIWVILGMALVLSVVIFVFGSS
ncbi:MAG: hypothetical protein N2378_09790 [Chloroflexaceae bacterium]|nr:hypothetical protein [Chloroflexaceae bacterium]